MYFDTSTLIGTGSTGASGGTSFCATWTKAGGGCISIVWFPVILVSLPGSSLPSSILARCWQITRHPTTDGDWNSRQQSKQSLKREKGGLIESPLRPVFVGAQKLNVIPVVAALIVAPP